MTIVVAKLQSDVGQQLIRNSDRVVACLREKCIADMQRRSIVHNAALDENPHYIFTIKPIG